MADETKPSTGPASELKFEIVEPEGGTRHIYVNFWHISWTGMDISLACYQVLQPNREVEGADVPNTLVENAIVTFSWPVAKTLHKFLTDLITRYEKANGEIKTSFPPI